MSKSVVKIVGGHSGIARRRGDCILIVTADACMSGSLRHYLLHFISSAPFHDLVAVSSRAAKLVMFNAHAFP